jgi:hypothetical protein
MTIEEFRRFGWKAGMRMKYAESDTDSYDIEVVNFIALVVKVGDGCLLRSINPRAIDVILNPDGTVAWRKE